MKIHRVVQMLGATTSTGKLADDMYDLGHKDYYSEAEDRYIPISHMDFQHMVRAFVKQNDEDVRTDTQEGKCADLTKVNAELRFQIEQVDRNQTVSKEAYDIAWQNMELWKKRYESQLPTPILGDVKMFSEIPNDPDGGSFVYLLRKYLNNVSYKIRVRGQYLDEQTKKTEGWRKYERGQPLEKSKCFRVYIDVKKDVD